MALSDAQYIRYVLWLTRRNAEFAALSLVALLHSCLMLVNIIQVAVQPSLISVFVVVDVVALCGVATLLVYMYRYSTTGALTTARKHLAALLLQPLISEFSTTRVATGVAAVPWFLASGRHEAIAFSVMFLSATRLVLADAVICSTAVRRG